MRWGMDDPRRKAGVVAIAAVAVVDVVLIFLLFRGEDRTEVGAPEGSAEVRTTASPSVTPDRSPEASGTESPAKSPASPTKSPAKSPAKSPSESPTESPSGSPPEQPANAPISLELPTGSVAPATPVPVQGRYTRAESGTRLVIERRQGSTWVRFPLPTATRADGRFRTFVALTEPGSYRLRVRDPEAGLTSDVSVLRVG